MFVSVRGPGPLAAPGIRTTSLNFQDERQQMIYIFTSSFCLSVALCMKNSLLGLCDVFMFRLGVNNSS